MAIIASYLEDAVDTTKLSVFVKHAVKALKPHVNEFDSIAFRGVSGALVGPSVAMALDKHMIVVRKKEDKAHSRLLVEGYAATQSYVIVDDLVDSGNTLEVIRRSIQEWKENTDFEEYVSDSYALEDCRKSASCFAIVLYLSDYSDQDMRRSYMPRIKRYLNNVKVFTVKNGDKTNHNI